LFAANPEPLTEAEPSCCVLRPNPATDRVAVRRADRSRHSQPRMATHSAGSLLYSTVRPRQFIVVPLNQPPQKPARAGCTHHSNRRPLPQTTPLPRCRLRPQPHPTTDNRRPRQRPSRPTSRPAEWPVSPFVVTNVPGTTRSTPTDCDCLAATPPRPEHGHDHAQVQLLLRPHSQTSAFESPARPRSRHRRPSRQLKPFLRYSCPSCLGSRG